ncbi:MAG: type II secretion system F family protein, partial [Planctomycetaceae bacterium]|nr:type II secretion system F family protein [Planctomycetaceae bacterium]
MDFFYTARNASGAASDGVVVAQTAAQARQLLRGDGLFPLTLTARVLPSVRSRSGGAKVGRRRRVSANDLLMLTSQLSIMARSGVDLADSLKGVAEQCENPRLKETLHQVFDDVAGGETFSEALGRHSALFGETYIVAIQAAEASGRMSDVLDRLTRLQRYEIRLRNTITSILTYPIILFFVAMMVSTALILFVLPQFATVFEDLEKPVPASTQILLDLSSFVRGNIVLIGGGVCGAAVLLWRGLKTDAVRVLFDRLLLTMKGIGPAVQSLSAGRLFTLMGTMLQSGIPLVDALTLCRTASRNRLLQ